MEFKTDLEKTAKEWVAARDVISAALMDWGFVSAPVASNDYAAAIIARLAKEGMLIVPADQVKESAG